MIVADNDVISYFWLNASRTDAARAVRKRDSDWSAPLLWISEFRNVLYQHMRHRELPLREAIEISHRAETDLWGSTLSVSTTEVLRLASDEALGIRLRIRCACAATRRSTRHR